MDIALKSKDRVTLLLNQKGIRTWSNLLDHVKQLPYGRNSERTKFELVLTEGKGSCSTKHALIKQVADSNGIDNVKLILAIYKMTNDNTKGIGDFIIINGLEYIPEAHCYLQIDGNRLDITKSNSNIDLLSDAIIEETEIQPIQVGNYKVDYHKKFIRNWIEANTINKSFDQVWSIREKCIAELSGGQKRIKIN